MNLEQEKKLVAEKLMGWEYMPGLTGTAPHRFNGRITVGPNWDIDTERKWWDEIWEELFKIPLKGPLYFYHLDKLLGIDEEFREFHTYKTRVKQQTAKPEFCWRALIKTLEG